MDAIIRSSSAPAGTVLLPQGRAASNAQRPARGIAPDLRDLVREAHEESAIATAVEGLALGKLASNTAADEDAKAERERATARQAEIDRGYQVGLEQGKAEALTEWKSRIEDFDHLLDTLAEERNELLPKLEDDLVAIAYGAVVEIVGDAAVSQAIVKEAVRKASIRLGNESPITVRVASAQLELINGSEGLDLSIKRKVPIDVVEDPRVVLGGCIIETGRGTLDARLETQLERLKTSLLSVRAHES